jgi:hypothetical protein
MLVLPLLIAPADRVDAQGAGQGAAPARPGISGPEREPRARPPRPEPPQRRPERDEAEREIETAPPHQGDGCQYRNRKLELIV